jgi:NADH dehydrogenase
MNGKAKTAKVVIVGAGFAGLKAAQALKSAPVEITLLDTRNFHTFQPLLYQVATAALDPEEIASSVRGIFSRQKNLRFRMARVTGVDWATKTVATAQGDAIAFDYLVLAAGAVAHDFGIPGVREHTFGLKSLEDALVLRQHVLRLLERADAHPDLVTQGLLHVVIVGGGPMGVELAGALAELFAHTLPRDYPNINPAQARVTLLEAAEYLLGAFHPVLRQDTLKALRDRGVDVRFGEAVTRVAPDRVTLKSGTDILTQTVIWSAGITASPLAAVLGVEQTRGGRVVVADDLSLPAHPESFVIGDMAAGNAAGGGLYPQMARPAMQSGSHVAAQILRRIRGEASLPFVYRDPGIMATIGRNAAVAQFPGGLRVSGFIAWLMWVFLHLMQLVGFRNRFNVFVNWMFHYFGNVYGGVLVDERQPGADERRMPNVNTTPATSHSTKAAALTPMPMRTDAGV